MLSAVFLVVIQLHNAAAQETPNAENVFRYICEKGILHPEIVIKQAILESGWFKAPFLMKRNNIFAFRIKEYMHFKDWKACVDYYKKWQDKHYKDHNEDYYNFLVRIKYATPQYPIHVKKIKYTNKCND